MHRYGVTPSNTRARVVRMRRDGFDLQGRYWGSWAPPDVLYELECRPGLGFAWRSEVERHETALHDAAGLRWSGDLDDCAYVLATSPSQARLRANLALCVVDLSEH